MDEDDACYDDSQLKPNADAHHNSHYNNSTVVTTIKHTFGHDNVMVHNKALTKIYDMHH